MKRLIKCFIPVICFISLTALITACTTAVETGDSSPKKEKTEKGKYSDLVLEKDPATNKVYDFNGLSVVIYDWYTEADSISDSESDFQKEQKEYIEFLEKTYNFKCIQKKLAADDWDDYADQVSSYCKSDEDDARIFVIDSRIAVKGYEQGLWANISSVPNIDWNKGKWNKAVCKDIPGYTFAAGRPEPLHCIFFNKKKFQEEGVNPESLYDLQKQGEWNWNTFEDYCSRITRDTDNDGIIDQYALSCNVLEFAPALVYSKGAYMILHYAPAQSKYNVNDKIIDALYDLNGIMNKFNKPKGEDLPSDYFKDEFSKGETFFYTGRVSDILENGFLYGMKDDLGMLCISVQEDSSESYFSLNSDNMLVIPSSYSEDKINQIMKIYDLWSNPVPGYESEDLWKDNYYKYFSDKRAVDESLQYMIDNPKVWTDELYTDLKWTDLITAMFNDYWSPAYSPEEVIDELNRKL